MEIEAEIEAETVAAVVLAVEAEVAEAGIDPCFKLSVVTVVRTVKYLSVRPESAQCCAANVLVSNVVLKVPGVLTAADPVSTAAPNSAVVAPICNDSLMS